MLTISQEDFKKKYGTVGLASINSPVAQPSQPTQQAPADIGLKSMLSQATSATSAGINQIKEGLKTSQEGIQQGDIVKTGRGVLGQAAGAINTAFSPIGNVINNVARLPVISDALGGVDNAAKWLGDKIGNNPTLQKFAMENPNAEQVFSDALTIGLTAAGGLKAPEAKSAIETGINTAKNGLETVKVGISDAAASATELKNTVGNKIVKIKETTPEGIMQRVARIPPTQQAKFQNLAGETVGQYLTKRGIFGNVEDITKQLYTRFKNSYTEADNALASLKGSYSPRPVKTMLDELLAREKRISTPGAPSPLLKEVKTLSKKSSWSMSEINNIKRAYERNVKVDYLKTTNPEGVAKATNLDSAVRNWQVKQAESLGLKNLPQINKETQLAKTLMDSLGKASAGSAANNAMTLTDWIMLSGGNPESIAGFLVKKGFSSKSVQAAIAKVLNKGRPVMGEVKANIQKIKNSSKQR